ncbi:SPD1 [Symbiodinium microadriaticum]|nr:SPD1 [Symbiodinium microadriaticum]
MQFIEANGGCVTSNKFASFFSSRPKHRAAAPKLRNFFEKHPQHFCISDEGNNQHWTVSLGTDNRAVARKIMSSLYQRLFVDKSHSAQQALKVDGGLTEGQVAADLVNLIQAAGGSMLFNEFTLFFKSRPQHRAAVPRLRQFLERHPELFRILDEGNSAVWKVLLVNCSNGADISGSTDTTPTVSLSPTGTESVKQSTETCVQKLVERRLSEDPWSNGEDPWSNSLVRAELPHLKTNQHTSASKEGKEKQDNRSSTNGSAHEEDPWAGGRDPWSERVLVSSGTVTSSAERYRWWKAHQLHGRIGEILGAEAFLWGSQLHPLTRPALIGSSSRHRSLHLTEAKEDGEEGKLVERRPGSWAEEAWGQHDLPSKVLETCDKELHQAEEQRCVCELDSLLSKLPEKLFTTMSAPQLGEVLHQAKVQRLVLQRGRPLQAALCSGWLAAHELPGATFTSQDLADVASQLTAAESPWRSGIFRIPGCLHRASFVYRGQELDAVNLHVSRLLPGLSNAIAPQLSSGSLLFLGPATSGKTSSLREAAASLAHTYQVVLLDFHEELPSGDFDRIRSPVPSDSDPVAAVDRAIAEQSPEVIAAEFADVAAALQSAQLCSEAGVRLLCTLRGTVGGLTAAFARSSVPGSGTFPFDTVVVLRRQLDTWHVYAKSGATSSLGSAPSSAAQHSDSCAFLRKPRAVLRLKILGNPEGPSIPESEGRMSATPSVHTLVSEPEEYGQI